MNLNGTRQTAGSSEIALQLIPGPGSPVRLKNLTLLQGNGYKPGDFLYIYRDGSGTYGYTDTMPPAAPSLASGDYTLQIIDTRANVLLHSLSVHID